MNTYKVLIKKKDESNRDEAFWHDVELLVIASNFSNAEDKAKRHVPNRGYIRSISLHGQMTDRDTDVIIIQDR